MTHFGIKTHRPTPLSSTYFVYLLPLYFSLLPLLSFAPSLLLPHSLLTPSSLPPHCHPIFRTKFFMRRIKNFASKNINLGNLSICHRTSGPKEVLSASPSSSDPSWWWQKQKKFSTVLHSRLKIKTRQRIEKNIINFLNLMLVYSTLWNLYISQSLLRVNTTAAPCRHVTRA